VKKKPTQRRKRKTPLVKHGRRSTLMLLLMLGFGLLLTRAAWLEIFQQDWLKEKSSKRQVREVTIPAYRGMILDRNNEPLAVSSPVATVTCDPRKIFARRDELKIDYNRDYSDRAKALLAEANYLDFEEALGTLAKELGMAKSELVKKLERYRTKHFMYLARRIEPETAERVMKLDVLPTLRSTQEYRRFYPASETFAHVVGFTNIEGNGTEGIERFMNKALAGKAGKKRVVRDRRGRVLEDVEQLERMVPGKDVQLSIDRRIQYVAYKELKKQVYRLQAQAGAVIVLDAYTGEILAMANMPAFNPNNRRGLKAWSYRNRAVTDALELGSTIKPFTIAAALDSGVLRTNSYINTSPGFMVFGEYKVRDPRNMGSISLAKVLAKSSNVGASKIALKVSKRNHWMFLSRIGFGRVAESGFSNETAGSLLHYDTWQPVDQASHGYGYGIGISLLQMAHAYTIFATGGNLYPITVLKRSKKPEGQRVLSQNNANAILHMLETVVSKDGTGERASVDGYRVAGKTGTAYKVINKKYRKDKRIVSFIGLAPVSDPKVVVAVMLDEPKLDAVGGKAAAPVFSRVMAQALRVLDARPDNLQRGQQPQFSYLGAIE
jgi:cell division protein FtsI (penicillin-binding protein 3)